MAAWLFLLVFASVGFAQEGTWPDLSQPARAVGGGERDAAVVVGVEGYAFVAPVPGAESNAKLWHQYLTEMRGIAPQNVKLLTGMDATREEILDAARQSAELVGQDGTLWFVFVGHGAPSGDGKDGLLVAVDAQQKASSLQSHSVKRGELLKVLGASKASSIAVILDACFSGRGQDGASIAPGLQPLVTIAAAGSMDPRIVVLTAAKGDQFAGPLPGANRPAFSYLVLGGLRGWATTGKTVTAGELWQYATNALGATLRGRNQTPDIMGKESAVVGASAGEKGPSLAKLASATAGGGAREEMFKISNMQQVPKAQAPAAISSMNAADFRDLDVDALGRYDQATKFDKGDASAEEKALKWRDLAKSTPKFAVKAGERASQWDRYAKELASGEESSWKLAELRDRDWEKLGKLLSMDVVSASEKTRWAEAFVQAYGRTSELNPYTGDLAAYLPAGAVTVTPRGTAAAIIKGKAGIEWIRIPAGTFTMGTGNGGWESPAHTVTIKSFQMARTEVTNKQYRACVQAGVCRPSRSSGRQFSGDDQPVVGVDWNDAKTFSKWVDGRLPSEAEWEYAARSAGKDQEYPWGNEDATCERAVIQGCGTAAAPVCSKPAGNTQQGLCDMAGNALEWVQDVLHPSYKGAPTDERAWGSLMDLHGNRVYRGGSWNYDASIARVAHRGARNLAEYEDYRGFRPAR